MKRKFREDSRIQISDRYKLLYLNIWDANVATSESVYGKMNLQKTFSNIVFLALKKD